MTEDVKFHPAAEIFPLMVGDVFKEFVADIKANGLQQPIIRHQGVILEGRNRYRACKAAGVEPDYIDKDDIADPVAYVISANIRRRHLNSKQKRDLIAKLLQSDPTKSDRQIADQIGVSHHTAGAVREELEADGQIAQQDKILTSDGKWRDRKNSDQEVSEQEVSEQEVSEQEVSEQEVSEQEVSEQDEPEQEEPATENVSAKPANGDIGPDSEGEIARKLRRLEWCESEIRRLEFKITGLESEVKDLRDENKELKAQLAMANAGPLPVMQ